MTCPICGGKEEHLGNVPFEHNLFKVPIQDHTPMAYYRCTSCAYISCPDMLKWTPEQFSNRIYNDDYIKYDPEYAGVRSEYVANSILSSINPIKFKKLIHLDFGSGSGGLSKLFSAKNINSSCYDPYSNSNEINSKFNFITAIEVFEHSSNIRKTISDIKSKLTKDGVILFTTLLGDNNTDISWEYILPRNGHISILSEKSLKILAKEAGLFYSSINTNFHVLQPARSNIKGILGW